MGWSLDGRYLSYFTADLSGGILYLLPLEGAGERNPVEAFRSTSTVQGARLSPDSRFLSYMSNQSGRPEMYVRPVDPSGKGTASGGPWQISTEGGLGMGFWRQDGKEFYYLAADRGFMAVDVSTSSTFEFGKPRLLFRLPEALGVAVGTSSVSRDGERFVVAAPAMPRLQQITVFDRQGKILNKVGEPGSYGQTNLSPDGARVVAMRNDPRTNQLDIWTFDVATGKGYPVTNDNEPQTAPIWSPDGKQVAMCRRRNAACLRFTGRPGTAAETPNSSSPIRRAPEWFSPTGLRTGSSWPSGPKSSCSCLWRGVRMPRSAKVSSGCARSTTCFTDAFLLICATSRTSRTRRRTGNFSSTFVRSTPPSPRVRRRGPSCRCPRTPPG